MSDFIVPPNQATGCLLRSTKVGEACPLFGERIEVLPDSEIEKIIAARKAAQIRGRDTVESVLNQGNVGSCATESAANGLRITKRRQNTPCPELNPWFIYYHTSGGRDQGSSIDENLKFIRENGVASMEVWPRSKGWQTKPSNEAYVNAKQNVLDEFYDVLTVQEAKTALALDFVVVFGHDAHSELMVDILSLQNADVLNSWSKDWGDGGYHTFPFSRINFGYGCFAYRTGK